MEQITISLSLSPEYEELSRALEEIRQKHIQDLASAFPIPQHKFGLNLLGFPSPYIDSSLRIEYEKFKAECLVLGAKSRDVDIYDTTIDKIIRALSLPFSSKDGRRSGWATGLQWLKLGTSLIPSEEHILSWYAKWINNYMNDTDFSSLNLGEDAFRTYLLYFDRQAESIVVAAWREVLALDR